MINSIDQYLYQLRKEMSGCDRATIQDALSDAEEYLRNAVASAREARPGIGETEALPAAMQEYGTPAEIADAYRRVERRSSPSFGGSSRRNLTWYGRFFGVMAEPRAWGALFYFLLSLATGIIYFTLAVTGISLSFGLLVLIIGVPFAGLFMLLVRGVSLVEGRMVEALLGVRMPRRALPSGNERGLWARFKALITDKYTWFSLGYMILQLPLGITYFTVFVSLISASLWLVARPILELGLGVPAFVAGVPYYTPGWLMPFAVIGGIALIILTMHFAKIVGRMHGSLAKAMLVRL